MNSAIPAPSPSIVPPAVTVVILTWNGRALTLDCLRSLEGIVTPNVRLLVVDNASTDGTVEAIQTRYIDRVDIVINTSNLGYAGGNNVGIRRALENGARFVLLLNNDTTVDAVFIDELLRPMQESDMIGITAPKIYYAEPPNRIWYAGGEVSLWRGTARHIGIRELDHGQYDRARDVIYASGCALLARREVFERAGFLDETYRAYFEDVDLCVRASRAGFRVRYVPTAKLWHRISASTGGQLSAAKIRRKFAGSLRFLRSYARPYHWITIPLFFVLDMVRIIGLVLVGRIRDADPR
jgi:GT2 family glycosyltransferase